MTNGFDNFLDSAGKALEIAPKLYDDTISPAAKEVGKTLAIVPSTVNALLAGVRKWNMYQEYSVAETDKLLSQKLANTPPEKLVEPEAYVAVPALQAISYSMDNDELRNLYANLLAKAMNIDTKNDVHPAFIEVIKQLSPYDAELLKKLFSNSKRVVKYKVRMQESESKSSGYDFIDSLLDPSLMEFVDFPTINFSLDNLERLKIVNISDYWFHVPEEYAKIDKHFTENVVNVLTEIYPDAPYIKKIKGSIQLTEFGKKFIQIIFDK